jgi:hypothetical protein
MRGDHIIEKGVAKCIRKPVGKNAEILGEDFKVDVEYSYKKLQKKLGFIQYEIDHEDCDAITFKQHFIITKIE